jgi:hypothetical protein
VHATIKRLAVRGLLLGIAVAALMLSPLLLLRFAFMASMALELKESVWATWREDLPSIAFDLRELKQDWLKAFRGQPLHK